MALSPIYQLFLVPAASQGLGGNSSVHCCGKICPSLSVVPVKNMLLNKLQVLFSHRGLLAARIGEAGPEDFCRQLLSFSEKGRPSLMLERRTPEMQSQASSLRNAPINLSEVSLLICWYNLSSDLKVSLVIKFHIACVIC